jgi:predicted RND superfamily exporter protein
MHSWKPEEIFHLVNNRLADQIHGISDIESIEKTILAENQTFDDINKIMHRQARPMIMFKLGTDDTAKIAAFIAKMDAAVNKGENIYIPDDVNSVSYEVIQVNVSQMLMEWRNDIRNKFYRTIGLPQIVPGAGGQSTESESKVIYLAFEQLVEKDQRYLEKQIEAQLGLSINFTPPATLSAELQQDESKDGSMLPQPSDTTAGVGR